MNEFLKRAFDDGALRLEQYGRAERVRSVAVGRAERWSDPEERVRAAFYAELRYRCGHPARRIGVEVTVSDRSPNDFADLVVFHDEERKRPFAVVECKAGSYDNRPTSDAVFAQAVEQAWGNGNAHKFRAAYVGVVAGATRRFLDCDDAKFGALERDANVMADLPVRYGRPPEHKFAKAAPAGLREIAPVDKGELLAAIDKTHQTLWGGGGLSPPAAFGEFCKLIFIKVRDEKRAEEGPDGTPYAFQSCTDETTADLGRRIRALYVDPCESGLIC